MSATLERAALLAKMEEKDAHEPLPTLLRRFLAEGSGTFALTLAAAGGEVIGAASGGEVSHAARAIAPGLVVMALIYAQGDVSGAHFNPAVTLAFALRRDFPFRLVPGYWAAQIVGAVLAAALLRGLFPTLPAQDGMTLPHYGLVPALTMETALSWLLITVILGTASRYALVGPNAALAVGATIALCGLFAAPVSGASMNPARSLGPAIVTGQLDGQWVYVAGPVMGAFLALLTTWLTHGPSQQQGEDEAAQGKQ